MGADAPDLEAGTTSGRRWPLLQALRPNNSAARRASALEASQSEPGADAAWAGSSHMRSSVTLADLQSRPGTPGVNRLMSISIPKGQVLGVPGSLNGAGTADLVSAVKQLRKASMMFNHNADVNGTPGLSTKSGSLASYFYAPNQVAGRGAAFSPCGQFILRYGYGPDIKILKATKCEIAASLTHTLGHIRFATFSPDGSVLVAASDDCKLLVWNVAAMVAGQGKAPKAIIDVGAEPLAYCQVSGDGKHVLSCDDEGQLELWSVESECMVRRYEVNHASKRAAMDTDSTLVISCSDFDIQVTLLDFSTGSFICTETFEGLEEARNKSSYVISADGSHVLVYVTEMCYIANCAVYNTHTQSYHKVLGCGGVITHAEFSADGSDFVLAGRDDKIHVYDSATGSSITTLDGHTSDVLFCKVSFDRRYAVSGDNSGQIMLWDVDTGSCMSRLQAHSAPVVMCDLSRDCSRALSVDSDGHAYVWNLDTQDMCDVLRQHSELLCCVHAIPGGRSFAVGYADGTVRLWQTYPDGPVTQVWSHSHHESVALECVTVSPTGGIIASGSRDGRIVLVKPSNGGLIATISAHSDSVTTLLFSANGASLASSSRDATFRVWPVGTIAAAIAQHTIRIPTESEILTCAMSPNGKVAALGCASGSVFLYSLASSRQLFALVVSDVAVQAVDFCSAGKYLSVGCADGCTAIVEVESGRCVRHLVGNAQGVQATWVPPGSKALSDLKVLSVCSRQAIMWEAQTHAKSCIADFISDSQNMFHNRTMPNRHFISHNCLSLFDPTLNVAIYDMRTYDKHPGNSYMFRNGTALMMSPVTSLPLVLYTPPHDTLHMLLGEAGGVRALDFSSDGHLLVSGNVRGELVVWDVEHRSLMHKWAAHKRAAITCVKFSHDSTSIYSCGEDCKVILWNWRTQTQTASLVGHQAAVTSVDMSLDGSLMTSGDKDGMVIIWETDTLQARQIVAVHEGPVLCCSMSPDGSKVASSGADEHVVILESYSGRELMVLDSALDGKGLTIKFSYDGTRVQIGGEKGSVLIWDVQRNCLLYDISAHNGKVYDCSWSGDSRRLLSVGSDGRARLWDAAAGSEICAANLERGFGVVDAGGFIKCDLSVDGSTMAGVTARGQLIRWSVAAELRRGPEGSLVYQWLASMPLSRAKEIYLSLLEQFPLLPNAQDSRGWTLLMHAAHDSNPEITRLIIGNVRARSGVLGLTASSVCRGLSSHEIRNTTDSLVMLSKPSVQRTSRSSVQVERRLQNSFDQGERPSRMRAGSRTSRGGARAARRTKDGTTKSTRREDSADGDADRSSPTQPEVAKQSLWSRLFGDSNRISPEAEELHQDSLAADVGYDSEEDISEPNAIKIALAANSADCVNHLLDAVLSEKITPGSYHAITSAVPEVAERYPTLCDTFMNGLPLLVLGDVEVPSSIASQERIVRAANSYTSYKEMWAEALQLDKAEANTAMVVMEAVMVRLPFAAAIGSDSMLRTLVEANVPVETFGSHTLQAIIDYKWQRFARKQIYTKSLVYLTYVLLFTAYAVVFADDQPGDSFLDLLEHPKGQTIVGLSLILFLFGTYYMGMELYQMYTIGLKAYVDSFWNFIDLLSYAATLVIMPCVLTRTKVDQGDIVPALVSLEVIMLWIKQMFFALAVDGLGTFIYMTIEIIKGMRYFMLLLFMLFVSFGTAFMVLFRGPGLRLDNPDSDSATLDINSGEMILFSHYKDVGSALLSAFLVIFGNEDPRNAVQSDWPQLATALLCIYNFALIVVLLNMLITLMGEVYKKVVRKENHVFLQGRAELIIEVETTMNQLKAEEVPPYLHLLRPAAKQNRADDELGSKLEQVIAQIVDPQGQAGGGDGGDSSDDEDGGGDNGPGPTLQRFDSSISGAGNSFSSRRETHMSSAGHRRVTLTSAMTRRRTMQRQMSMTINEDGGSGDNEMLMREMLGMKRLMEGMLRQVKLLEANQQHLLSNKAKGDSGALDIPVGLSKAAFNTTGGRGSAGDDGGKSEGGSRAFHAKFTASTLMNAPTNKVTIDDGAEVLPGRIVSSSGTADEGAGRNPRKQELMSSLKSSRLSQSGKSAAGESSGQAQGLKALPPPDVLFNASTGRGKAALPAVDSETAEDIEDNVLPEAPRGDGGARRIGTRASVKEEPDEQSTPVGGGRLPSSRF